MPDFEDTPSGLTANITGEKAPVVQRPVPSAGGARLGVNTAQPEPKPAPEPPPPPAEEPASSAAPAEGTAAGRPASNPLADLGAAFQKGFSGQQPYQGLNPFSPIDWAQHTGTDAWLTYQTGRRVAATFGAFLDPNAVSSSVHNIWEQDTAQAQLAKTLLSGLPGGGNQNTEAATAGAAGMILPIAGNPLTAALPEGRAAQAGVMVGLPALQGALSTDPNEQTAGLAWAALTGAILGAGHLPQGLREPLAKAFSNWPVVENVVRSIIDARKTASRNVVNPEYDQAKDYLSPILKEGFPGAERTIAPAAKAGEEVLGTAVRGPEGNIAIQPSQTRREAAKVLRRLGVESVDELVTKAAETGFTGADAKLIAQHWSELGMPYDLREVTAADIPLRDPRAPLREIHNAGDEGAGILANQYLASLHHYLDQIGRGHFAAAGDPMRSTWRTLIGVSRNDKLIDQQHSSAVAKVLAYRGISGEQVGRAIEGDLKVYHGLPPEGRMVVDGFRAITAGLRRESQGTDYASNFIGNWMPHLDQGPRPTGTGAGATALTKEARKHRETAIVTSDTGQLVSTQRFGNVAEANAGITASRNRIVASLTNPLAKLDPDLVGVQQAEWVRNLAASDPAAAQEAAIKLAAQLRPLKETDLQKVLGTGVLARQMKAIHSQKAMNTWSTTLLHATDQGGARIPAAVKVVDDRHAGLLAQEGYKRVDSPYMGGFMFHGDLADLLGRATSGGSKLREGGISKAALDLESQAIARIMFMPPIHGMNMAGRAGIMWMRHPIAMTHYLTTGKALLPHQVDDASFALRSEAFNSGVLPHQRNMNYAQSLQGAYGSALGDTLEQLGPEDVRSLPMQKLSQGREALNNYFWGAVNDFGVMAYHLEKDAALRNGVDANTAKLWAARRANTWMGHVAPEDTNPLYHDLSRAVLFAPNWWRTWAQLMLPIYKDAGVDYKDPMLLGHIVSEQAKMFVAMAAFQKVTGNALNLLLSGHTQQPILGHSIVAPWAAPGQTENLPGNQDRLEATAPYLDQVAGSGMLGGGGLAGELAGTILQNTPAQNEKTGARRTVENPLGRFQRDLEMMGGLDSGHPGWEPGDAGDGLAKFAVSRLSPLIQATGALMNLDPYRMVTSGGQNLQLDSNGWSPWNIAYAALMMSPLGMTMPQAISRAQQNDTSLQQQDMPFGTKVSKGMADALGTLPNAAERVGLSWLTGVNAPYDYAEKTRGTPPSDQQLQRYREAKDEYQTKMGVLSAQALGGQTTPSQWLQDYRTAHTKYATIAETTFKNAPSYVNGSEGMLNDYERLYDKATAPDGSIDYAKLEGLQNQFRSDPRKTPAQLQAMDDLLNVNDQRFPMLALYHKTISAYKTWQQSWAAQNGYDVGQIRREASEYNALYNDPHAAAAYLSAHRELATYQGAKRREFEQSPAGVMYAFYTGNHYVIARYIGAHHLQNEAQGGLAAAQALGAA